MKRIALLISLIFAVSTAYPQKNNRTSAFNYWRNGKLDKAKEYIDLAIQNPQTINDAKTWFYKGNIYLAIHMSEFPPYKALDANALKVSYDSYLKAQQYDEKKEFQTDIFTNLFVISEQFYNAGVEAYNLQDFKGAMQAFWSGAEVSKSLGSLDTMALYNAGMTAELAHDHPKAMEIYQSLLDMNYQNPVVYSSMGNILLKDHDTTTAMTYLEKGRQLFPDDFNLLIYETNVYLNTKQTEKALANLEKAVKIDENNPTIYFAVGTIYDQLKTSHPEDSEKYILKAESAYTKAIEIDSAYFDPIYNLGALYVNEAAVIIDKANALPLSETKKYDELKEKADFLLGKSIPYLEKAHELQPNDMSTMSSLKEIYTRLGLYEKLKDMNQKIHDSQQ